MDGISAVVPGVTETSGVAVAISPDVDGTGSTHQYHRNRWYKCILIDPVHLRINMWLDPHLTRRV